MVLFDTPNESGSDADGQNAHRAPVASLFDGPETLTFVKGSGPLLGGHFRPKIPANLRNSLLIGATFLEVANLADFPANYWNESPIPNPVYCSMIVCGLISLFMVSFAIRDATLSWRNMVGLGAEQGRLEALKKTSPVSNEISDAIDCLLDVNYWEWLRELIDRLVMDVLLGFGAIVVGAGTIMAVGGDDPEIFLASNLLTGYIGNSPCAVYGLVTLGWAGCLSYRARKQQATAVQGLANPTIAAMIKCRTDRIHMYNGLSAAVGILAGGASLLTATQWRAYFVLGPCCLMSALLRCFWKAWLGYDRPLVYDGLRITEDSLLDAINFALDQEQEFQNVNAFELIAVIPEAERFGIMMKCIANHHLFEDLCLDILKDDELASRLFPMPVERVTIDWNYLMDRVADDGALRGRLREVAKRLLSKRVGEDSNCRKRWLLEVFVCYKVIVGRQRKRDGAMDGNPSEGGNSGDTITCRVGIEELKGAKLWGIGYWPKPFSTSGSSVPRYTRRPCPLVL